MLCLYYVPNSKCKSKHRFVNWIQKLTYSILNLNSCTILTISLCSSSILVYPAHFSKTNKLSLNITTKCTVLQCGLLLGSKSLMLTMMRRKWKHNISQSYEQTTMTLTHELEYGSTIFVPKATKKTQCHWHRTGKWKHNIRLQNCEETCTNKHHPTLNTTPTPTIQPITTIFVRKCHFSPQP